jgi:hypothetical protein
MSSFATSWAWDQDLEKNAKLVLLFLADNVNRFGRGTDLEELVGEAGPVCGLGAQRVRAHVEALESRGLLRRDDSGGFQLEVPQPKRGSFRLNV